MDRFIRFFSERHLLVNVLTIGVIVAGIVSATRSEREGFPNVTMPLFTIRAQLPGASARDIETKLTIPLEEAIEGIDGLESYHTIVNDNQSVTRLELYDELSDEKILEAERDIRNAVDAITDFPVEMTDEPVITRLNPGKFPMLEVALSGPTELLPSAAKRLEAVLRRLDSVSEVSLVGLRDPEVRILLDPGLAREHGVTLLDLVGAIERRNVSNTGGVLETERARRQIVLWSRYERPEDVARTVLRALPGGGVLRISDVARVESGREDTGLLAHTNGRPGVSVVVRKRESADILDAADEVMQTVRDTPLPAGVSLSFVNDQSFFTRNRLNLMATNGAIGAVLVALIVFLFLAPSAAVWVMVGVPVVILGVIALMPAVGMTINMISMAGFVVVLGMLVDDAVVVSEKILATRQEGFAAPEAAVRGTVAVARPVIASAITTMLAFCPLLALGGMAGRIAWNIPAVVMLALALSLFESFAILPGHMSMVGRGAIPRPKRAFVLRLERGYERVLRRMLPHRGSVVAGFVLLFALTMAFVLPQLGVVFFPQDDSDALFIKVNMPLGTPLERTEGVVTVLERQLPAIVADELLAVTARIGHQDVAAVDREHGSAENEAVISVFFVPLGRERSAAAWAEELKTRLRVPPEARLLYEPKILGPPVGRAVEIHIASNDDALRRSSAALIARTLQQLDGLVDVEVNERPGTPQIDLNLDYEKLAQRGLEAQDVGLTLKAAFFGLEASEHRDLEDTTTYRVLFDPSARRSLDALLETPVRNRRGELVLLRDVVGPVEMPAVSRIYHREGVRTATVTAGINPQSDLTALSLAAKLDRELFPRFADQPEIRVYLGGEAIETGKSTEDLAFVAMLALAGIFVVVALMLGSFLEAFFVVSVVPFALVGVILTFFLHGHDLSLFALLGTIGLSGVVVNASIVMVDSVNQRLQHLASQDPELRQDAVIEALVGRLRPIIVTSLSTLGGVLPTAYGLGGYDAVLSPMSLALGWGLAFSTSITLFLVPSLYSIAGDVRKVVGRMRSWVPGAVFRLPRGRGHAEP
ncbi:MAG: efflux RND transporter permease subunit [Myxococcota bacterium]